MNRASEIGARDGQSDERQQAQNPFGLKRSFAPSESDGLVPPPDQKRQRTATTTATKEKTQREVCSPFLCFHCV